VLFRSTLDIETRDGQAIFKRLVEKSDFVIESFAPGYLDIHGLGYSTLNEINPGVIVVSITPFGQTGPRRDWKASDLVAVAMGGLSHITGSPDRPPVRVALDQAHVVAGAQAAMGAMIAHYYRQTSGKGQQVDVSVQESVVLSALTVPQFWDLAGFISPRTGSFLMRSGKKVRHLWQCKDGFIAWRMFGGGLGVKTRAMVDWMASEGQAENLTEVEWEKMNYMTIDPESFDQRQAVFAKFFKTRTKEALCKEALKRGIVLLPASTPKDVLRDPQLIARNYWKRVEHPEMEAGFIYPGGSFNSSEFSSEIRRAPLVGEHNSEIYEQELGLSKESLAILKQAQVI
jgi:benzylsuccinate CoA-transferase BbsE subunit